MLGALLRYRTGLANGGVQLIKFALCNVQLAIDNLQTHDERVNVGNSDPGIPFTYILPKVVLDGVSLGG